jgi:hypothetical protein
VVGLFLWIYLYDTLNRGSKGKISIIFFQLQ